MPGSPSEPIRDPGLTREEAQALGRSRPLDPSEEAAHRSGRAKLHVAAEEDRAPVSEALKVEIDGLERLAETELGGDPKLALLTSVSRLRAALQDDPPPERYTLEQVRERLLGEAKRISDTGDALYRQGARETANLRYAEAAAIREVTDEQFDGATPTRKGGKDGD